MYNIIFQLYVYNCIFYYFIIKIFIELGHIYVILDLAIDDTFRCLQQSNATS